MHLLRRDNPPPFKRKTMTTIAIILVVSAVLATTSIVSASKTHLTEPFPPTSRQRFVHLTLNVPRGGGGGLHQRKPVSSATAAAVSFERGTTTRTDHSGVRSTTVRRGGAEEEGGSATIPNEIFNLVKSIVGAGVLSLPAGIAAFGDSPSALLPSTLLIAIIGIISAYGFSLIGRVCSYTGATSYRDAWDKTVGTQTSWITALSCTLNCMLANVAYSMILADTFQSLLGSIGIEVSRTNSLFGVTVLILLPLCLLKNLSSLAPFSLLGIIGMAYTTLAMAIRYLGGGYSVPDGKFLSELDPELQPTFGTKGAASVLNPSAFILICMLSSAYLAHFNAPKFYIELRNNTISRFNTVVSSSFGISITIFAAVSALGFLTFGSSSSGLILNNYAQNDGLMSISRVAVAVSIVFSYPLVFVGTRDGILDLMNIPYHKRNDTTLNNLTIVLLAVITGIALKVKDLSFVMSFGGATLGNALIYLFPALMFRSAIKNMGEEASSGLKMEVYVALLSALLGVGMGVIGARMAIKDLA